MPFKSVVAVLAEQEAKLLYEAVAGDLEIRILPDNGFTQIGGSELLNGEGFRISQDFLGQFTSPIRPGDQIYALNAQSQTGSVRALIRSA